MNKFLIKIVSLLWCLLTVFVMAFSLISLTPLGGMLYLDYNEFLFIIFKTILGIFMGLIYVFIGIILYRKYSKWRESMMFLVGENLTKGSCATLFALSIVAGIYEEGYTRGLFLLLAYHNYSNLILIAFVLNILWTLSHLLNVEDKLITSFKETFKRALPHMVIIFLSGIPWFLITIATKSLLPAIISHFLLDFLMGKYVRKNNT